MTSTQTIMGMPITVEIVDPTATNASLGEVFDYFRYVDEKFSTYKDSSEISQINRGELEEKNFSADMKLVLALSEETKKETDGFFNIRRPGGILDPSGLVKGWAIKNAADLLEHSGFKNFYVEAGGDIQTLGTNKDGNPWIVGIKNPFNQKEVVKVLHISGLGVATSGTYIRGQHIYNPNIPGNPILEIVSLTVIGPDIYEADRFATAAFAMGRDGIMFIEKLNGFEGYMINKDGMATMTTGFEKYTR